MSRLDLQNLSKMSYYKHSDVFRIRPTFNLGEQYPPSFDLYMASIEQLIEWIIPASIKQELMEAKDIEEQNSIFHRLYKLLPLFKYTTDTKTPCAISVTAICPAEYTSGVGRYITDMLSRWLIPGKQYLILGGRMLSFEFLRFNKHQFYFAENFLKVHNERDLGIVLSNLPNIIKELRINILAVYYARYIVSVKSLSFEQKTAMIEENISSLMDSPAKSNDSNIHDEMQQFLIKLSAEERFHQVKENITHLMHARPKTFDRDVFYEIRHFMVLFRDKFTATRDHRHVSRVIAFQYLFKKTVKQALQKAPDERHISLRILKTLPGRTGNETLGILITMNLIRETERFDKRHILEAIRHYIPDIQFVKDSYITERADEKIRSFYLEVDKGPGGSFSIEEIKQLRRHLPKEFKGRIENVVHPIFMPRNEEEVIRNIISLSKQLKYIRDIPQVIISYEKQTDEELSFTVILVRLLKGPSVAVKELFKNHPAHLKFSFDEAKVVGYLKRKYAKEANIFRVGLPKAPFFRKDYSVDLQKARQVVVHELMTILGEFRDFNGGIIIKQNEVLDQLRALLPEIGKNNEFLLENFFYSLKPGIMQSILSPETLKNLFLMLLEAIEQSFTDAPYFYKTHSDNKYFLMIISTPSQEFKEEVQNAVSKLKISSNDLTTSSLSIYEISALGYIYRMEDESGAQLFQTTVLEALEKWKSKTSQPI